MEHEKNDSVKRYLSNLVPEESTEHSSDNAEIKTARDYVGRDKIYLENKSNGQNNYINLKVGGFSEKEKTALSGDTIIWQQQKEMRDLVDEISQLSKLKKIDIWQKFSAHFDGYIYKELPKERYREAAEWLEHWRDKLMPVPPKTSKSEPLLTSLRCSTCDHAQQAVASIRKILVLSILCGVLALAAATYFGFKSHALTARLNVCEFVGKSYSLGSIIDNTGADNVVCVAIAGMTPQWQVIKPKASTR